MKYIYGTLAIVSLLFAGRLWAQGYSRDGFLLEVIGGFSLAQGQSAAAKIAASRD